MTLRGIIRSKGLRQNQVAGMIGMSESHFSEILSGDKKFPVSKVAALAEAIGVSVAEIIDTFTVDKPSNSTPNGSDIDAR